MSLPLYSQNEYCRLHVQTPTVSYNKCNTCVPVANMPDILSKTGAVNADIAGNIATNSESTKEGFSIPVMPNMYLLMFFLIVAYLVVVGYIASYKPHSDGPDASLRPTG